MGQQTAALILPVHCLFFYMSHISTGGSILTTTFVYSFEVDFTNTLFSMAGGGALMTSGGLHPRLTAADRHYDLVRKLICLCVITCKELICLYGVCAFAGITCYKKNNIEYYAKITSDYCYKKLLAIN
nr:hypothetical protein Iba_chr06bCG13500 [Ipomoea batatas]